MAGEDASVTQDASITQDASMTHAADRPPTGTHARPEQNTLPAQSLVSRRQTVAVEGGRTFATAKRACKIAVVSTLPGVRPQPRIGGEKKCITCQTGIEVVSPLARCQRHTGVFPTPLLDNSFIQFFTTLYYKGT